MSQLLLPWEGLWGQGGQQVLSGVGRLLLIPGATALAGRGVKVPPHASSSSSAALHFRRRGEVCNLIPKQSLASIFLCFVK